MGRISLFRFARGTVLVLGLGLLLAFAARAQVLARPGWAGSGVAPEPWWLRAVFYRIDPARFQDSDGDGKGDVPGIVQRLGYLQSLGIDAVLLDGPVSDEDLSDLIREASRHHLRVLVTVPATLEVGPRDSLLNAVRAWLSAGVAGFQLPNPAANALGAAGYGSLVSTLQKLVQSFPGERVLLTEPLPSTAAVAPAFGPSGRHGMNTFGATRGGVLVATSPLPIASGDAEGLRDALVLASQQPGPGMSPLQRFAALAGPGLDTIADATLLFGGRGAVVLDFGREIGLNTFPSTTPGKVPTALPVMQWTPSNRTPAIAVHPDSAGSAGLPAEQFGTYHPYVRLPRDLTMPLSPSAHVAPDANLPIARPDPNSMPGFTTAPLQTPLKDGARWNVATEDRDPGSLLHAYRQLIALHHANASLRHGELRVLTLSDPGVLVWVRRAPAGARTVANVVGAVNLSDVDVTLSIRGALEALGLRPGPLRPLFASPVGVRAGDTVDHLTLPPNAALLCELSPIRRPSAKLPASRNRVGG